MFGILILFAVVFIIVLAFKKDKTVTTITRKDENGKEITETIETEHHSAARTAAKIVVIIILSLIILSLIIMLIALNSV